MPPSRRASSQPSPATSSDGAPVLIDKRLLREWPLPQPDEQGDKEHRGRVLVVGGAREMPGAILLAAVAALRAGVGKLRIAAPESIALGVGTAVPEGRVFALPEAENGALAPAAAEILVQRANEVQCVLFGPGLVDEEATSRLLLEVLPQLQGPTVVLDAAALACLREKADLLHPLQGNAIITPHAGEMASCLGMSKEEVSGGATETARHAAERFGCVAALKGAETIIAAPGGESYSNQAGNVGLATSGSGDTLAGLIAGLAARGASPLQAASWGVHLHARAGDRLARRIGPLGFLARELLAEVPHLMAKLGS